MPPWTCHSLSEASCSFANHTLVMLHIWLCMQQEIPAITSYKTVLTCLQVPGNYGMRRKEENKEIHERKQEKKLGRKEGNETGKRRKHGRKEGRKEIKDEWIVWYTHRQMQKCLINMTIFGCLHSLFESLTLNWSDESYKEERTDGWMNGGQGLQVMHGAVNPTLPLFKTRVRSQEAAKGTNREQMERLSHSPSSSSHLSPRFSSLSYIRKLSTVNK